MSETAAKWKRIDEYMWMLPPEGGMRVPGIIYASRQLMDAIIADESPKQVANVAHLPGIVSHSLAMPDIHWGYGFPIGGVAAFDMRDGIVSPGGVGYDINCGCRLMTTALGLTEVQTRMQDLVAALFRDIPSGVGSKGPLKLSPKEEKKVLLEGSRWAIDRGYGEAADALHAEDGGVMKGADPEKVSDRAMERGKEQLGTLGSGNHFVEIEVVEEIFDKKVAEVFGLAEGQVAVLIHSGSRGLGHQICDDYLARMVKHMGEMDFDLPDRQLACAYLDSARGRDYLAAMACAANYAWANRQMLMHWTRETFARTLQRTSRQIGMKLLYDVCHNIAKIETFPKGADLQRLCVHRKGATRAFPPGHPDLPETYRSVGQPVLIPGDMGTGSYVLVGAEKAFTDTFGSTCHGAGRLLSRAKATKVSKGRAIARELASQGIIVMASSKGTLQEEMPEAYKNLDEVVEVVHRSGLSRKVARLRALGCIKG